MVYGFAKQSGGGVTIKSEADRGTCVNLYLPRTTAPYAERIVDDAELPMGQGEIVVLVEDDPGVRALTQKSLDSLGYDVHIAADAYAGLSLVRSLPHVDILLTDVILPGGMSGPELAQAARTELPTIKILFMSGLRAKHDHREREATRRRGTPEKAV